MPADQLTRATPLDGDLGWRQINVEPSSWGTSADVIAHRLVPVLDRAAGGWWYVRKHPHWRVRHRIDTADAIGVHLRAVLDALTGDGSLRAWHPAVYEPEIRAFGGPAGIDVAHDLFRLDSRTTVGLLAGAPAPAGPGRRELSVLAVSRLLRAAGLDWYEQGDVWARVAESRTALSGCTVSARAPAAVRRLLTLDTGPRSALVSDGPLTAVRTWLAGFDEAGTRLGELARLGRLTRGLRAVLAHHVVFHWNRLALPPQDQLTLAVLAREALLPATDDAS